MGRPKDFPKIYDDLLTKYKSKSTADKEYKEYLTMAREQGLSKEARLDDIKSSDKKRDSSVKEVTAPPEKKQRMLDKPSIAGAISSSEKELYERLVETERLRAQAEKQRGDDLSKIAMMLASGKGGAPPDIIPQSPPAAADKPSDSKSPSRDKTPDPNQHNEEQTSQQHKTQPTTQKHENRTKARHDKKGGASASKSKP